MPKPGKTLVWDFVDCESSRSDETGISSCLAREADVYVRWKKSGWIADPVLGHGSDSKSQRIHVKPCRESAKTSETIGGGRDQTDRKGVLLTLTGSSNLRLQLQDSQLELKTPDL